jgi:integration host factor subunit alpha
MGIAAFQVWRFPPGKGAAVETLHRRESTATRQANNGELVGSAGAPVLEHRRPRTALTKEDLQNLLFENIGLSKRECRDLVSALFEEMRSALESGESVKLEGFGRFQPKRRPKRWARNLRSGERIAVKERRVVTFHASRKLTESILLQLPQR